MGMMERLDTMPNWPARMTAPIAAMYMGVSQSSFLSRFGSVGVKEGGNTLWAKAQLDCLIAVQFGLTASPEAQAGAAPGLDDPYEQWKAGRRKA